MANDHAVYVPNLASIPTVKLCAPSSGLSGLLADSKIRRNMNGEYRAPTKFCKSLPEPNGPSKSLLRPGRDLSARRISARHISPSSLANAASRVCIPTCPFINIRTGDCLSTPTWRSGRRASPAAPPTEPYISSTCSSPVC